MNADELEAEGMSPAAVPHVLCGAREVLIPGVAFGGSCVFMPHETGHHSWHTSKETNS